MGIATHPSGTTSYVTYTTLLLRLMANLCENSSPTRSVGVLTCTHLGNIK
jgi:hypothetical protein